MLSGSQWPSKPPVGTRIRRSDLTSSLSALWAANEGTGLILHDLTGNGSDATITGATWQATQAGAGLNFASGQIARVASTSQIHFVPPFSVFALIVLTASNANGNFILAKRSDSGSGAYEFTFGIDGSSSNQILYQWYNGTSYINYHSSSSVQIGVPNAVGLSVTTSQIAFYLNGEQVSVQTPTGSPIADNNRIEIGNFGNNTSLFSLDGSILLLGKWDRPLLSGEHGQLAANPSQIFAPPLVSQFAFYPPSPSSLAPGVLTYLARMRRS